MTRYEQITALARRMNTDWLASFHDPASDMDVITLCATIAIELAEATRAKATARCRDLQAFGDAHEGNGNSKAWARAAESLAGQIDAMPLPIGDEYGGSATDE